jgi:hypothetical protein
MARVAATSWAKGSLSFLASDAWMKRGPIELRLVRVVPAAPIVRHPGPGEARIGGGRDRIEID